MDKSQHRILILTGIVFVCTFFALTVYPITQYILIDAFLGICISMTSILFIIASFPYYFGIEKGIAEQDSKCLIEGITDSNHIECSQNIIGTIDSKPIYEWVKLKGSDEKFFYDRCITILHTDDDSQLKLNAQYVYDQIQELSKTYNENNTFIVLPNGAIYSNAVENKNE